MPWEKMKIQSINKKERKKKSQNREGAIVKVKNRQSQTSAQLIPVSEFDVLINAQRLQITPSLPQGLKPSEIERTEEEDRERMQE